jgi:hypothetical protein
VKNQVKLFGITIFALAAFDVFCQQAIRRQIVQILCRDGVAGIGQKSAAGRGHECLELAFAKEKCQEKQLHDFGRKHVIIADCLHFLYVGLALVEFIKKSLNARYFAIGM